MDSNCSARIDKWGCTKSESFFIKGKNYQNEETTCRMGENLSQSFIGYGLRYKEVKKLNTENE
jgi:hypothetical protein